MPFSLESGEEILAIARRHWFLFVLEVAGVFFLAILPPLAYAILPPRMFPSLVPPNIADFLYQAWLLLLWIYFFVRFTMWYFDLWIITNKRLVDIEQRAFFFRKISTLYMEKVEDITIDTKGILQTLIGYGTIVVQTAAEEREFRIIDVDNPERVKQIIFSSHHEIMNQPRGFGST